ncbi:MAG TPA: response regulator [Candidatus Avidesulfovibrio excrementigallinarum]|nr:response regulator [Candidatus Avidesulfovibrio excrementigallinarum]
MKAGRCPLIHALLVAENSPETASYVRTIANTSGFSLLSSVATSEEALNYLEALNVDLLLIDQFITSMTGIELLMHIRRIGLEVDAILISTVRESGNVQLALRYGVVDYLVKPVAPERFRAALVRYRDTIRAMADQNTIDQEDIDHLLRSSPGTGFSLPKGLDQLTLERVLDDLRKTPMERSTRDIADSVGLSRVTTRKYLDYLKETGEVSSRLEYRTSGRPLALYGLVSEG